MAAPVGSTCALALTESVLGAFAFSAGAAPGGREAKWLLPEALALARDHGLFASAEGDASVNRWISHCNLCLNSLKTRWDGLSLLAALVRDCSTQVFVQHCCAWLRAVTQLLQPYEPEGGLALAVRVLADLLRFSAQLPELAREVSQSHLPALMSALLALRDQRECMAMEGLLACMRFYPKTSGTTKVKLELLFVPRLTATRPTVRELALGGFVLLPSLGGGGPTGGQKHAEAWTQQLHDVLRSLHAALTRLYDSGADEAQDWGPGVQLALPEPQADSPVYLLQVKQEFSCLARALVAMLREEFAAPVKVPAQPILTLVCRALAISPKRLAAVGEATMQLLVLPAVHTDALSLLEALIRTCGKRLLRFGDVINRAFPQVLATWSPPAETGGDPGRESPYSEVRVRAYGALAAWVDVCGATCRVLQDELQHAHDLLRHLVRDASPASDLIRLQVGRPRGDLQLGSRAGKRHKGGAPVTGATGTAGPRKSDARAGADVCLAALHALVRVVLRCGSLMPAKVHKRLHELAVSSALALQAGGAPPRPLGACPACRVELYRLLLHLLLAPSPALPPPLQPALRILARGQRDDSAQVSAFCADALVVASAIVHPRVPSLQLPAAAPAAAPPLGDPPAAAREFSWPGRDPDAEARDVRTDDRSPLDLSRNDAPGDWARPAVPRGSSGGGSGGTASADGSGGAEGPDDSATIADGVAAPLRVTAEKPRRAEDDGERRERAAASSLRSSGGTQEVDDVEEDGRVDGGNDGRASKRKRGRDEREAVAASDENDGGCGGGGGNDRDGDDDTMRTMLADFVDCPPEGEGSCRHREVVAAGELLARP
uniref:Proline-, glutamic acid- and leucine-rich protein 1-like isoform X2 n=1 Tax=Petromyzon marinus TaxID=7757 RepID=A0AAJ7U770_PETMA|nr:proline-, glutamic acid- and leucine-rich protein 1-like isoform X2 [Petromyzon marinus]